MLGGIIKNIKGVKDIKEVRTLLWIPLEYLHSGVWKTMSTIDSKSTIWTYQPLTLSPATFPTSHKGPSWFSNMQNSCNIRISASDHPSSWNPTLLNLCTVTPVLISGLNLNVTSYGKSSQATPSIAIHHHTPATLFLSPGSICFMALITNWFALFISHLTCQNVSACDLICLLCVFGYHVMVQYMYTLCNV